MKAAFSKELMRCLLDKYGRMPSAAVLARDFNFRSGDLSPITAETARRWIRGMSMPEMERLKLLIEWLAMRVDFLNEPEQIRSEVPSNRPNFESRHSHEPGLSPDEMELVRVYRGSEESVKRLMLSVVHTIQRNGRP
jgi:hypothetical protein